jgi:hypothetical protein
MSRPSLRIEFENEDEDKREETTAREPEAAKGGTPNEA